MLMRITE